MFGVHELADEAQYRVNPVAVAFNNSSFGDVRRDPSTVVDGRHIGSEPRNPDCVSLAESFGAKGVRASAPAGLQTAIEEGFEEDGQVPIEIPIEAGSEASLWPFIHPTTGR